jgi:2,4-dienoyl-CoA reductase-like NADH-dependent reductase (Old Yellow Enzyme family)
VAQYFKFHSVEELASECRRLGLSLRFSDDLSPLFRPVKVGPLLAGNALCIQPMEGCDGELDGRPGELTFRRFRRFGAGGAKLIWGEATAVLEEGRANPRQLLLTEQTAPELERMLRECRQAHRDAFGTDEDLIVGLQLTHSGRYSYRRPLLAFHDPLLDPLTRSPADLLDDDHLRRLADYYVAAARLARRIGFDFVDVKQCHRYLLSELLAAKTRPGPFGGSLENRARLARTIIQGIRAEVPDLVIATRLNVFDCIPFRKPPLTPDPSPPRGEGRKKEDPSPLGGEGKLSDAGEPCPWTLPLLSAWGTREDDPFTPDLTEPRWWIGEMQRLGVALVNVSMGNPYATPHVIRPFEYSPPDGYETPEHPLVGVDRHFRLAAELQQAFPALPMVGSGYSYLQEFLFQAGAANIRDGGVTFVGVGRAALPQPDFARQLLEHGKLDRKRVCRTFSYCTALMRAKHNALGQFPTGCPPFDKEVYGPIWDEARRQDG